jgi:catechol 2,3-dioxygenase-like lactoylglutathione lyase family enzyme
MTKQETETPQVIGVGHVALSARDPAALADFYCDVLGLQVVPTDTSDLGENVFLSSHPAEVSVDLAYSLTPSTSTPPSRSVRWRTFASSTSGSSAGRASEAGPQPWRVALLLL